MSEIFVSYAREDADRVAEIVRILEAAGICTWWDGDIPAGENYRVFIDKKLVEAPAICVIWSHSSVTSTWVAEEAEEGVRRGTLVPILIDNVDVPRGFRSFQALRLMSDEGAAFESEKLILRVRELLGKRLKVEPIAKDTSPESTFLSPRFKKARAQSLSVMVAGAAIFAALAMLSSIAPDVLGGAELIKATQFRIFIALPTLLTITALAYYAKRQAVLYLLNSAYTLSYTLIVCYIARLLPIEYYGPDKLGLPFNLVALLACTSTCLAFNTPWRIAALAGSFLIYCADLAFFWHPSVPYLVNSLPFVAIPLVFIVYGMRRAEWSRRAPH